MIKKHPFRNNIKQDFNELVTDQFLGEVKARSFAGVINTLEYKKIAQMAKTFGEELEKVIEEGIPLPEIEEVEVVKETSTKKKVVKKASKKATKESK